MPANPAGCISPARSPAWTPHRCDLLAAFPAASRAGAVRGGLARQERPGQREQERPPARGAAGGRAPGRTATAPAGSAESIRGSLTAAGTWKKGEEQVGMGAWAAHARRQRAAATAALLHGSHQRAPLVPTLPATTASPTGPCLARCVCARGALPEGPFSSPCPLALPPRLTHIRSVSRPRAGARRWLAPTAALPVRLPHRARNEAGGL